VARWLKAALQLVREVDGWMCEDGFGSHIPEEKKSLYGSGSFATDLLVSSQYASGLKPRQNDENNRGQKSLLHWCINNITIFI